jgi:hypothetical protein
MSIVGITPVIWGTVPRWTLARQSDLEDLQETIDTLSDKLIAGKLANKAMSKRQDYMKMLDRLKELKTVGLTPKETREILSKFPHDDLDLASEFLIHSQNSIAFLIDQFPVTEFKGYMGATNTMPTDDKVWRFFMQLNTLDHPLDVMNWICAGTIQRSQSKIVRDIYPTLSVAIDSGIYRAINRKAAKSGKPDTAPRLPYLVTEGLNRWMDRRSVAYNPKPDELPDIPPGVAPPKENSKTARVGIELSPSQRVDAAKIPGEQ